MKFQMKLGAEPKKVAILLGLLAVAAYLYYDNLGGDAAPPRQPAASAAAPPAPAQVSPRQAPATADVLPTSGTAGPGPKAGRRGAQDYRPSLKQSAAEQADLSSVDPTLRLDLLARLADVKVERVERSLFDFAPAPAPKLPEPKIVPGAKPGTAPPAPTPKPDEPANQAEPPKPQSPPITFKFYGFLTPKTGGPRRAFLLDGEEILTPAEGEVVKRRYRIVRIGVNSVTIEDLDFKSQQTIAMSEEQTG